MPSPRWPENAFDSVDYWRDVSFVEWVPSQAGTARDLRRFADEPHPKRCRSTCDM
jgi:hypothetical protein